MGVRSDPKVRNALLKVRLAALDVMGQRIQNAYFTTTVNRRAPTSAFVLTYQLYAEEFKTSEEVLSKTAEIRNLNPTLPVDRMVGDLTVLQK